MRPLFLLIIVQKKILIALSFLLCMPWPFSVQARMAPTLQGPETPLVPPHLVLTDVTGQGWWSTWLSARDSVRQDRPREALHLYAQLLANHPQLLEARWERARLLLAMERYDNAERDLEQLLEVNPDNLSYQQAQGLLLLATGRTQRAVAYLARVWAGDEQKYKVGVKLYQAYISLGQKEKALPVLEALHRKKADDVALQEALFRLYIDLGNDQQARALGASLANDKDASFEILLPVAQVHDRLGLSHLAAEYWQKILVGRPDYSPAHAHLAAYYSGQGREAEALPHLLHSFSKEPANNELAGRIGVIYVGQNRHQQAIPFLEQYLSAFPDDADKSLVLARSYRMGGNLDKSSRLYSRYLELVAEPDDEIRQQAAQVFTETGETEKAVAQYEHLVGRGGSGGGYLVNLARNLSATGRYQEALQRWRQIAAGQPGDLESRLEILSLLDKMGRGPEMIAMLREIHELDASNYLVTLKLAEHHFRQGDEQAGWHLFTPLVEREFFSPEFLAIRARIFHFLGLSEHAFRDMSEVVAKENSSDLDRLIFLDIAGALGRRDVVMAQAASLADKPVFLTPDGRLRYARALGRVGEIGLAEEIYEPFFLEGDVENQVQARLDAAEMYRFYGLFHEAEQQYRLAWLDGHDQRALFALVDLNLLLGEVAEAESWLNAISVHSEPFRCQRSLYELRVLNGLGEFEDLLLLGRQLLAAPKGEVCTQKERAEIKVQMAKAYFEEGDDDQSLALLTALVADQEHSFSAQVNLFHFYSELGDEKRAKATMREVLDLAGNDAGLLAAFMEEALEKGLYPLASVAGRHLRDAAPLSFGYLLRFVRVLELNGEFDEADNLVSNLLAMHGDNALLNLFGARVALALGHYDKGLAMADQTLAQRPQWFAALLVKARLQWALFHWSEALAIYGQATSPSAQHLFLEQCAQQNIALPPQEELSLWMKVLQPMARPGPLQRSLVVDFVMSGTYEPAARQAASFFAAHQWQKILKRERAARKSVQRREYYHAVKQYESLVRNQEDPTLLFDLAGVYSSLDRVGDEAVVYQRLQAYNPDFPGLNEAIRRNHLKRQPRAGIYYSHLQKKGRSGYYDIDRDAFGFSGWLSPRPQREITVSASRIHYQSPTSNAGFYGKRADVALGSKFFDYVQLDAKVGGHALSNNGSSVGVYDFSATGLAGDRFESYIGIKRQIVDDTLASVGRMVMAQVYEGRAQLDITPHLLGGGKISHTEYSDDNVINGYSLWLSSVLLPEPNFLKATFLYEFLDAHEKNEATGALLSDGFSADDHPYWAPADYSRQHFMVNYKHKFSDDVLGRSTPSFFTAGYSFSYDVDDAASHVFRAGFNIEISNAWILKIDTEFEDADGYRTRDLSGTLLYRW